MKKIGKKSNSHFEFFYYNNLLNSKRSQSGIIAVVLIVLIVIVAVAIVWNIVAPLVREKSGEAGIGKFSVSLDLADVAVFETGASKVSVKRGAGGEIDSLKFVFYGESGNSKTEDAESLGELETKTYSFSPFGIGRINRVSVFPVTGSQLGMESKSEIGDIFEVPLGVVSWWRFDDEKDFAGNNHCGYVNIIDDEKRGKVASFNGDPAVCGGDVSLNIDEEIGISFWIKTSSENGEIIKKGNNYLVSLEKGFVNFNYGEGIKSEDKINDGEWHHVVATRTGIYVDSQLSFSKILDFGGEINSEELKIGSFNGFIDEMMLFNEGLANTEVNGIYNNQKRD